MDCRRIAELLPWLVNGTLPEPEKSLLGEHLAACAKCRQTLEETKFMLAAAQSHPPLETLVEYAAGGRPGPSDPALLEQHLAVCDECAEQIELANASFALLEEEPARVVSLAQFKEQTQRRAVVAPVYFWQYATIAAGLICALIAGYALYNWRETNHLRDTQIAQTHRLSELESETRRQAESYGQSQAEIERLKSDIARKENELAEKERELAQRARAAVRPAPPPVPQVNNPRAAPQANVVVLDVFPSSVERSDEDDANRLSIPRHASAVTLLLNSSNASTAKVYAVELRDSGGRIVWRDNNARRYESSDFTVHLPAQMLRAGNYVINIYALEKGQKVKIETYRITFARGI
jgi:hypothetical protein